MAIESFSVNPGSWLVEGNIVTDELDNQESYFLHNSVLYPILASDEGIDPTVGDTYIECQTPGEVAYEGLQEFPHTVDVDPGDSVWHSLYVQGSGTLILQAIERDNDGAIINTVSSNPLVVSNVDQEIHVNTNVTTGALVSFKLVTNSIQSKKFRINGVYVNIGESPRTGQNLVPDNVAMTGKNGSYDGIVPQGDDVIISVLPIANKLEFNNNVAI